MSQSEIPSSLHYSWLTLEPGVLQYVFVVDAAITCYPHVYGVIIVMNFGISFVSSNRCQDAARGVWLQAPTKPLQAPRTGKESID